MRNILIGTLILPFVFVACKHEDDDVKEQKELCYEEDTGYDDTGDTADSGVDTGETGDTAIDSGSDDSGNDTSLPVDTGDTAVVVDTGVETGTADTATEDTGSTDDTAVPVE
jgi:hypothetical protein